MQCRISRGHSYGLFSDGRTDGVLQSFAGTGSALKQETNSARLLLICTHVHGWRRGVKDGHRFRKSKQKHITTAVAAHPNTEVQIVPADGRYPVNGNTPDQGPRPKTLCACWRRCDSRHRRRRFSRRFFTPHTYTLTHSHSLSNTHTERERERERARERDA